MLRSCIPTSSEHLPSSPSGAEMQSAHNFVTLFSLKEVVVTQEPAAETSKVDTQDDIGHVAVTQELATDPTGATQEPPVGKQKDNDLHVAVTQEPATDPTGDTQEPPVVDANDQIDAEQRSLPPLEPAATQAPAILASLQEEIEFLKSQIKDYQQEIIMVKETYQNEFNLHILAQVASVAEKSQYNEYMCSECGEIYTQAGYKIVKVPMTGASPQPSPVVIKTEQPAVTQEPGGSSRIVEEETEPLWPTQTITEQKSFTDMYTQTEPSCINDAYTQTEPPCVSNAYTETFIFQELKDTWKTEYELSQGKAFQQQKSTWFSYAYKNWEALKQS